MSLSEIMSDFALGLRYEDIPTPVLDKTKLHLLDTIGCGLAAHALGVGTAGSAIATPVVDGTGATVIGRPEPAPAADAALANGMLCHALDFDDTHGASICHVSTVAVPALVAVSETTGAEGRDLLAALVVANELTARIGIAAVPEYMVRGFHPTSVCGVFGAVAGAARLLGLSRRETVSSLGIAASMSGGLFAYLSDGTHTKPIHAGWAARSGIAAAMLAAAGGEGPRTVFEDRFGFYASYYGGGDATLRERLADLGREWETEHIAYKAYPSCHFIHACLDAARFLQQNEGWSANDINSVTVSVPDPGVPLVLEPHAAKVKPRTEYDAKFSLPYSIATMLVKGSVDISSYLPGALRDPDVLELAGRVSHTQRSFSTYPKAFPGWVRLEGPHGRVVECERPYQLGAPENPLSRDDVVAKFRANATQAVSSEAARELEDVLLSVQDVADLRASLRALSLEPSPELAL
jgi:2-methylcitrate dehydratase PrpD